jgi:hypothetical protein
MADPCQAVFRQRICHLLGCRAVFYLCRHCDRGQRYCSSPCRQQSRRQQCQVANRRHQQSPEGRLDHRDRQCQYRKRLAETRVTDQGSAPLAACASMAEPRSGTRIEPPPLRPPGDSGWVQCQICGRWGRWINPFHFRR